ncbi:MAG: leucyl aminopeptidase family protein [Phycisphaerae bacterium]|nr:leucyl aminopeptidase family protein [Phycisphaerae bacterium]
MFQSIRVSAKGGAQALVVGQFKGEGLDAAARRLDADGSLVAASRRPDATGELGVVVESAPAPGAKKAPAERYFIVGLGERGSFAPGSMRTAAASVGRRLAGAKLTSVSFALGSSFDAAKADAEECGAAAGEGLGLLSWDGDRAFKGSATPDPKRGRLTIVADDARFRAGLGEGLALAESANLCRTLSQTPPNIATTSFMAAQARKLARATGLRCTVLEGDALVREKLTGLINVGKASENKPCLIRLEYRPRGKPPARASKPAVLIGKTMTYDTGGLSLKINNGMVGMKRDKDGGCAVLGAMHAIATVVKPRRPVVALLACAENSISDEAYRPDDILTYRNGVSVEVTNTDAEGRLVLADALCWACEKENPAYIVDLATLTGGVVVALGSTFCGMFCEDDKLRGRVEEAAKASGERVWRLPMHDEYRELMKSPVADILNSNPNRKAHPIQGAAFLSYFVEPKVPWCHLDIAGVHVAEKITGPFIEGPTGWGVRLLARLLEDE